MTMMRKPNETQECKHCKVELPLYQFHNDRRTPNGSYAVCKDCRRKYRRLINIPQKQYDQILQSQNNQCAICGTDAKEFKTALSVDHDWKTNKIRGLLCTNCNMGLGHFKDSPTNLNQAVGYLARYGE